MTAIIVVKRRSDIHVVTDSAHYLNGRVECFGCKVFPVAHWPGLVTTAGSSAMVQLFGATLAQEFETFDALVATAYERLPGIAKRWDLPKGSQLFFIGISGSRGPEGWVCSVDDHIPPHIDAEEVKASGFHAEPFQLVKLPDHCATPVPADQVVPAHWEGFETSGDTDALHWSLRKHLTMQRHSKLLPPEIGGIGGWGICTSIYPDKIEQLLLCRWDDRAGERITPGAINWPRWHSRNPKPKSKLRLVGA
jgi:hypothetical protein